MYVWIAERIREYSRVSSVDSRSAVWHGGWVRSAPAHNQVKESAGRLFFAQYCQGNARGPPPLHYHWYSIRVVVCFCVGGVVILVVV